MGEGQEQIKRLMALLPEGWQAQAKELGAFRRAREIKSAEDLLKLILLYVTEGRSFAGTSAMLNISDKMSMNKIAVYNRIRKSGPWLEWLCRGLYRRQGLIMERPEYLSGKNICLIDGSEVATGGGQKKYYQLHYCVELFTLAIRELQVTSIETGEKLSNFHALGSGDIVAADRMYGTKTGIEYLRGLSCDYVLRLRANAFTLYDELGEKVSVIKRLGDMQAGESASITAYYAVDGEYHPVRICALRKSAEQEQAGLERIVKTKRRKQRGQEASKVQQDYNQYIIVATSLGEEIAAERVLEIYRMRWQIELAFKRLKSLFQYGQVPMKLDKSCYAWFYGKLLLAALCETVVNEGRFSPSEGGGSKRSDFPGTNESVERTVYGADIGGMGAA